MRRGTALFLVINLIILGCLLNSFKTLIGLLFEDGAADAISRAEIPAPGSQLIDERPQLIPKIIHQTYINKSIPEQWQAGQKACVDLHPDYEYKLWTDEMSRKFIATEYPWFLDTFDSYPFPIQRADSIRYFVLAHYGGIYIDLDDGCNRSLDPLLAYPAWLRRTVPTGISNDAMGAIPQHPFFLHVIESLSSYNHNWRVPYITVMYTTGPLFLSVLWKEWLGTEPTGNSRIRLLMPDEYSKYAWSFFNITKGSSWHRGDAQAIFWMGQHWVGITVAGFALAAVVGACIWWAWGMAYGRTPRSRGLAHRDTSPKGTPRMKSFMPSFWRKSSSHADYELLNRIA